MRILVVLGTRPEVIKLAPIVSKAKEFNILCDVCFTGQHKDMAKPVLDFFGIEPRYKLDVMTSGQSLNMLFSKIVGHMGLILQQEHYDAIVVQGDTTTTSAAALAGFQARIPVMHVEAGLRTFDLQSPFPEEMNRRLSAICSELHFPPTVMKQKALLAEGIDPRKIMLSGNTGIDSLLLCRDHLRLEPKGSRFSFLNGRKKLILVTLHRRESFGEAMQNIMESLKEIIEQRELTHQDVEILWPLHLNPQVRATAEQVFGIKFPAQIEGHLTVGNVHFVNPLDYPSFVAAMDRAHVILSDSGGVQEEAPCLGKAVLVARETTERFEAVEAGSAMLVGSDKVKIKKALAEILDMGPLFFNMSQIRFPFGDGKAAERILGFMLNRLGFRQNPEETGIEQALA